MPNEARDPNWTANDFTFSRRELVDEFPDRDEQSVVAALMVAAEQLPAQCGRVKLIQHALEVLRGPPARPLPP